MTNESDRSGQASGGDIVPGAFRRVMTVVVFVGLVVAAVAVDRGTDIRRPTLPAAEPMPALALSEATRSTTWYCAEGTAVDTGRADETVIVANPGVSPIEAVFTVYPGLGQDPARKAVTIGGRGHVRVRIADIVRTGDPGVTVEITGGEAVVDHELAGPGDFAVAPCASRASRNWYFPTGTTAKDTRQYLAIFNPFGDDAVVDLAFATPEGMQRPAALRSLVIPAHSRSTIRVHANVRRQAQVGTILTARTGRVVAEQSSLFEGGGRRGLTVLLGATGTADTWTFAEGILAPGVHEEIAVFNPSVEAVEASVEVHLDGDRVMEPEMISVPPRAVVLVDANKRVPEGVGHFVVVRSSGDQRVVAAQSIFSGAPAPNVGATMMLGATEPASRWFFPDGRSDSVRDEWIVMANPGKRPARVSIAVLAGGQLLTPEGLGALTIAPGKRGNFRLGNSLQRSETPVVVTSDVPVFVTRGLYGRGVSIAWGIPRRDERDR